MATNNPINANRSLLTRAIGARFKQRALPTLFGRSFFTTSPQDVKPTYSITISTQRFAETMADDVPVGTTGNIRQWNKDTELNYVPPYLRELTQVNQLDVYNTAIGTTDASTSMFADLVSRIGERVDLMHDEFLRWEEKKCWDVMLTGKFTTKYGGTEDFSRQAASMVDVNTTSGKYWSDSTADIYNDILTGCNFIRANGKYTGGYYNLILGEETFLAIMNNATFKERAKFVNIVLDMVNPPQMNAEGAVLQGQISVGSYKVYLWTYPQSYDTIVSGVRTTGNRYLPGNMSVLLPDRDTDNRFMYGAVPRLPTQSRIADLSNSLTPGAEMQGQVFLQEIYDEMNVAHYFAISQRGMPILIAKDKMYTMQTLAS